MKFLTTILLMLSISVSSLAQPDYYSSNDKEMQQKYWKYHDQLRKYFLKVGLDGGESIPCRARTFGYFPASLSNGPDSENVQSTMKWADATIDMGYYISIIATEYSLLERHGEGSQATLNELYYALKALERLDFNAEFYLSEGQDQPSTDDINGLLLRDDVSEDFWENPLTRYNSNS